MKAVNLKIEHLTNPIGIDINRPIITWNCEGGIYQSAFNIKLSKNGQVIHEEKVNSNKMYYNCPISFTSKDRIEAELIVFDENGNPSSNKTTSFFEMGLLEKDLWKAKWITGELETLKEVNNRKAYYFKKDFNLDEINNARLYITAHGLYVPFINGKRITKDCFMPGTSEYDKRLQYQTYDISEFLISGKNKIEVILGDGWYRGKSGMNNPDGNLFGDDLSLLCQIEIDKKVVCISDETWKCTNGPILKNGLDFGELVDANVELNNYHEVKVLNFGYDNLVCSNSLPVREHETFTGKLIKTNNNETVIDFGQNMAGYVSFKVHAKKGDRIRLVHGETLDENGNFTIKNFQHESLDPKKMIYQEINYICKDGLNEYKPMFAVFGFRYVLYQGDIDAKDIEFKAIALYSDMEQVGFFACGNEDVNKLVLNSLWSMKSNFLDIPTDCPTRERQGWTGDAGVFVSTGVYLMDCYPVFRKWLNEVRVCQLPDGKVPGVAPKSEAPGMFKKLSDGSAGWADAIGIVPNELAKVYNDKKIIEENYNSIKKWVDFSIKRAKKCRLKAKFSFDKYKKYIVDTGFHWGEWLEPDVDSKKVLADTLMKGAPEVPTAYFAYSCHLLASDAKILGKQDDYKKYFDLSKKIKEAYRNKFLKNGKIISDRQANYVRPLALDILDEEEKRQCAKDLNSLIAKNNYHLNTGFLSTCHLCHVLTEYGYLDTAYKLLLQTTPPSWLYEIKHGATTIWETWDGVREDGSVHDSLNHYSYGAISGWLFKDVAGINLEFGEVLIKPHPNLELGYVDCLYNSPLGSIRSYWKYEDDKIDFEIELPSNVKGKAVFPNNETVEFNGKLKKVIYL